MEQSSNNGSDISSPHDRPLAVTLVCLWWFTVVPIGVILTGIEISQVLSTPGASEALRARYVGLGVYTGIVGLGVISMIGLWYMRKWSVAALVTLFVASQLIALLAGGWSLGGFLGWLIAVVVGVMFYSKMK